MTDKIWQDKAYRSSVMLGGVFFMLSLVINYYASIFATERVSGAVTDVILSNLRVYDVDGVIVYGSLFIALLTIIQIVLKPKLLPFVLKSLALFIIIRSVFISLTHLGPFFPRVLIDQSKVLTGLGLGYAADLFFSGHTGLPFLGALIFWDNVKLRVTYLLGSIVLGASVLLSHLHYSIDVFAAFFITFTIFYIATKIFPRDWERTKS